MIPYIFVFSLNYILAYYADSKFVTNKHLSVMCLIAIGVLNVIFAGCRDFGVGYDTNVYIDLYFNDARSLTNISGFFNAEVMDKGFLLLAYISTLLSKSSQSLLFVTEAFIITLTLAGLYNYKRTLKINISTYILLYWLILFFFSLNFMRQYCAMSILFYGYSYWQRDKKSVYLFFQIVAFFFHSSSALFVFVPFFDYMSKMQTGKKLLLSVCVLTLLIFSTLFFYTMFSLLGEYSVINEVYSDRYSMNSHGSNTEGINMGMVSILIIIIQICLYILARKDESITNQQLYMMLMLFITTNLFQMLVTVNVNLNRLALYFNQIYLLYLSLSLKVNQNTTKVLLKHTLTILLLIVCIRFSFNHKYEPQDYTYSSKILGIKK